MGGAREGERKFESRNLDNFKAFFWPSTLKTENVFQQMSRVGYVCIEESFDTFSIWVVVRPSHMDYGSRKSAMDERVKKL